MTLLGQADTLPCEQSEKGVVVTLPDGLAQAPAHSLKITPQPRLR